MKRYYVIFKGRVQGVGFRWTLCEIAQKYNITGWCENLINGDVDAEIQGEDDDIDLFFKDVFIPQGYIRIDDYALKSIKIKEDEHDFIPIYRENGT